MQNEFSIPGDRVRLVYFESHSQRDWRTIDAMLQGSHTVGVARILFANGEFLYLLMPVRV